MEDMTLCCSWVCVVYFVGWYGRQVLGNELLRRHAFVLVFEATEVRAKCIQPRLRCLGKSVTLADICRDHDMATHIHHTDRK